MRFTFDGQRVGPTDTAEGLGMEEGDAIEVFQEQQGGGMATGRWLVDYLADMWFRCHLFNVGLSENFQMFQMAKITKNSLNQQKLLW